MTVKLKVLSGGVPVWKNVSQIKLKVGSAWRNVSQAKLKVGGAWRNIFSSTLTPSIQTRVTISLSGGINASNNIMNDTDRVTITSTRYHWEDADGYTYVWQKSPDNLNWDDIGTPQSTTNPASGSSSSSLALTLSPSYFTSGPNMYFRFSYRATNSTYSTSASSESLSKLVSYYGTPVPIGQSPSITGSTVVGNTASANIGTWTNSPSSYNYRVYYTSGSSSYPLTYAGVKSVSNKYLSGLSAVLITSSNHLYRTNDTVVVSNMDALFNGSHVITAVSGNEIYLDLPSPTAFSLTSAFTSGQFVLFNGNAYQAVSSLSGSTAWTNAGTSYSAGDNVYYNSNRYRANSSLSGAALWTDAGTGYSSGAIVYSGSNRYQANLSISSVSPYNGGTTYSSGAIVYSGTNRYQSTMNNNIGRSVTNYIYWTDLGSYDLTSSSIWTALGSYAPGSNSMWTTVMPSNASFWTLQSFSGQAVSGTTTAPNYYEGTVYSSTSIPIPITTFDYKQNIDLRGSTSSGYGVVLNFGVKAYNQATLLPSEYLGSAFIYGIPILSIGSITPLSLSASVPFTSSYIAGYLLNLYTQPTITNIVGGATTVTYFANNTFTSGQQVTVTGVNPSQYNGTRTIQSANATSFTVSANITDAYISGGTAKVTVSGYPLPVNSNTSPRSITGLSESTTYYLEMTPYNNGGSGTIQTSSFTTLAQPTISNITLANTKAPGPAVLGSFASSASNVGTVTWTNGSGSSSAWLKSVTGAGTLSTQSDPSILRTSGTFAINSSGTADATIAAINKGKSVYAKWSQSKAASFLISYKIGTAPSDVVLGNTTDSNPEVLIYGPVTGTASQITINSITVYNLPNQQGPFVNLSSGATLTPTNAQTDTVLSGNVTFASPPATPTITYTNVTSNSFTVSWSSSGATSYNVSVYESISGASAFSSNGTTATVVSPSGLTPNMSYSTTVTAINTAGQATATVSQTTPLGPALTPTFGTNTSAVGGFTGSVTNFDANYNFGISTTPGSVSFSSPSGSTRAFTVSGLSSGQSATVTVTTSRTRYSNGSAQTTGSATLVQYSVSWSNPFGTAGSSNTGPFNAGSSHTAPSPGTREGFNFSNWRYPASGDLQATLQPGNTYIPTQNNITFTAIWTAIPVPGSVSSIKGANGGRTGTTFWNDPKATMTYTFANTTSATARIQRSIDNMTWTSGATETLSISGGSATQTTSQPTGNTSSSGNYYYRAQVISINGTTLGTPITSASFRNTITPVSNRALYP